MSKKQEREYAQETLDGKLTLWGTYVNHLEYIQTTNEWIEQSTRKGHEERLKNTIIPAIKDHDQRPIGVYDRSAVNEIIAKIKQTGQVRGRKKERVAYDEKTLNQFQTILEEILEAAADHYLCPPLAKNAKAQIPAKRTNENLVVRRFLRPEEEAAMLIQIIKDIPTSGPARLALLAYTNGLRPSECCGLNWQMLQMHPETAVQKLHAAQSAIPGTNRTKLKMKTCNGHRVLGVNGIAYKLLMAARIQLMERWVAEGESAELFDQLPLGTKGDSLTERCSSHHLRKYINQVFAYIGIRWEELAALEEDLKAEFEELEACGYDVDINDYSSPSFYLERHLYATSNVPLMLDVAARQYLQGHQVDDPAVSRRIYTSSAVQQIIRRKQQERPLLNPIKEKTYTLDMENPLRVKGYAETIVVPTGIGTVGMDIEADEPGDLITVTIDQDFTLAETPMLVWKSWQDPPDDGYPKQINVLRFYHDMYKPAAERLLKAFPELFD